MNEFDHFYVEDFESLSESEKIGIINYLCEKYNRSVIIEDSHGWPFFYLTVSGNEFRMLTTFYSCGYPLLTAEELRSYAAIGMLL